MIYLNPADRTKCAAINHVLRETSLANVTQVVERHGIPAVELTLVCHALSRGERVLWDFCRSIADQGDVSLFDGRNRCDDHSRRVLLEALALWFGVGVEAVAS